jgi:DNA-binding MarR family transcriptional regulator
MENLNDVVFHVLEKTIRTYRQFAQQQIRKSGLEITIDQWLVLKNLSDNPGISQRALSDAIFKDGASVTRILENLVTQKYVARKVMKDDKRRYELAITPAGKKAITSVQRILDKNSQIALNTIEAKKLKSAKKTLQTIQENCAAKMGR